MFSFVHRCCGNHHSVPYCCTYVHLFTRATFLASFFVCVCVLFHRISLHGFVDIMSSGVRRDMHFKQTVSSCFAGYPGFASCFVKRTKNLDVQSFSEVPRPLQPFPGQLPEIFWGVASVRPSHPLAKEAKHRNSQTTISDIDRRATDLGGRAYSSSA